jgi:hypothetical protein
METYLPILKAILSDWIVLTLDNPFYASVLAFIVFLITAILYSIRIASLKAKNVSGEKARLEMEANLNAQLTVAKQQQQAIQDELTANTEQMKRDQQLAQKEAERAARFEDLLSQRNKLVAGIIQTLATSFDLGERPVPLMGDIKAEGLWQQIDRVIGLLTNKLQSEQQAKTQMQQSYQAETVKLAEKEAQLVTLQTTLVAQTSQLTQLEQSLEEQTGLLKQQQDEAQHVLSQTLEKHLSELARLTELEQQALALVSTQQQLTQLEEQLSNKEALITQLETNKQIEQVKVEPKPVVIKQEVKETPLELKNNEEPVLSVSTDLKEASISLVKEQSVGVSGKLKSLFGRTNQETIATGPELEEIKEEIIESQPIVTEVQQSLSATSVKEQMAGMTGKFKSLFGKANQESITKEPDVIAIIERQPLLPEVEIQSVSPVKEPVAGVAGRFKSLFGKADQEPTEKEPDVIAIIERQPLLPEIEIQSVSPVKEPVAGVAGRFKSLFGKADQEPTEKESDVIAIKAEVAEAQSVITDLESSSGSSVKAQMDGVTGKLKGLFGKAK